MQGGSKLQVALARVQQWQVEAASPSDAWLAKGSTAGQRAIRVNDQGPWLYVPSTALQSATVGRGASKHAAASVSAALLISFGILACGESSTSAVNGVNVSVIANQLKSLNM